MEDRNAVKANQLNESLELLYKPFLDQLNSAIGVHASERKGLSWPFLIHVHEEYVAAPKKLMFVGMETHGWNDKEVMTWPTYGEVAEVYRNCMENQEINSPFWWFMRDFSRSQKVEDFKKAVIWTNLSKISQGEKRPTGSLYENTMPIFLDLLVKEINVLQPDILVVTTTNPHYQWQLTTRFGTDEQLQRTPLIEKQLFKLSSPELPENTFQLCHPNRLRFTKGGYYHNADAIIRTIQANVK